jgi:hypothetical protein
VVNKEKQFVRVHQVLLNVLIGKAGLFKTVPFIGQPVASVLRQVEAVVDASHTLSLHCARAVGASRNESLPRKHVSSFSVADSYCRLLRPS